VTEAHVGDLRLRRFRLGELPAVDGAAVERHTAGCGACRSRLKDLDDEQRQFEIQIPFERFAGGVERARRVPRVRPRPALAAALGLAAAAAILVAVVPRPSSLNRLKGTGGAAATLRIASAGDEQLALAPGGRLVLRPGDRVRLGVRVARTLVRCAVSVDEAGVVTPLYPAAPLAAASTWQYLPDSLELTGHGHERVVLVLGDRDLPVEEVARAARQAFERAGGRVEAMPPLADPRITEQFTWLLSKP